MPHCGIQSRFSTNCMPALPSSQPRSKPRERTKTAAEENNPQPLASVSLPRGRKASTIAATIGSQRMVLRSGISALLTEKCDEDDHADEEHQRVVANVAGLEEAQHISESADDKSEQRGDAVDHGVDALPEEARDRRQRTDHDLAVELIDVPLVLERA